MKTRSHATVLIVALVVSAVCTGAFAGPGPQYWQTHNANAGNRDASQAAVAAPLCPGSREVAVTVMKPTWADGRGPLAPVQIGTKRVCTVCPVASERSRGWSNGRGPQSKTEITESGVPHTCTALCSAPKP